jgi:hypothetical protein
MIDNLGTLVRIRCTGIKTARQTAQTKDRKASIFNIGVPAKKPLEKPKKGMTQELI